MKRESKRTGVFTRRALIVGGAQLAALGFLATRLYQVQVEEGSRYATLADYYGDKRRLFQHAGPDSIWVSNADDAASAPLAAGR